MNIIQFAHGEIYMLGAYVCYFLTISAGLSFWVSLPIIILTIGILGILLERFCFRPFRNRFEPSIIVAIGLMLALQEFAVIAFGTNTKAAPPIISGVLVISDITISWDRLLAIILGVVLILALFFMIQRTKIGQAMVAMAQDSYAASLQGIDVNRISALAMLIGCALAAIAGALMGRIFGTQPFMGTWALTKGIAVIILGGLGSIPGAVVGGLILGMVDGIIPVLLNSTLATTFGFGLIVVILILRPKGLLGHD
jgi:branched-chain amino acid transport system permease protein